MKERIYTIPVNDAFNEPCECPLCELEAKTSKDLLAYFMGPSMMEPDIRIGTNKKGFCKAHSTAMYNLQENRLGLGLMLQTHQADLCDDLNVKLAQSVPTAESGFQARRKSDYRTNLVKLAEEVGERVSSCALCDRMEYTMERYIDVILWQYFEDDAFREKFEKTKGFCLPHLSILLRGVAKHLSRKETAVFMNNLSILQNHSMDTMRDELLWFTRKFDYKNEKEPWGNSRDAVPRTIRKMVGNSNLNQ